MSDSTTQLQAAEGTGGFIELAVVGASCAGCVSKIEKALQQVPGVERAEMNFADRTALVSGNGSAESVLEAVQQAGCQASVISNVLPQGDICRPS